MKLSQIFHTRTVSSSLPLSISFNFIIEAIEPLCPLNAQIAVLFLQFHTRNSCSGYHAFSLSFNTL